MNDVDADDPEFLYDDLFEKLENGQSVIKSSFLELEERIQELNKEKEELKVQINSLQSENQKLTKQNEVLIRNISCLFKTAQMEIARKDKQIRSLQEEALRSSLSVDRSSGGGTARAQLPNARVASQCTDNCSKQMRNSNQTEELSECPSSLRKRMACDIQGNRTPKENGNDCNKRLQVEDRGSESLDQFRVNSMEYNQLTAGTSKDYRRMKPSVRGHDADNGNHSSPARIHGVDNNGCSAALESYNADSGSNGGQTRGDDVNDANHGCLNDHHHLKAHKVDNARSNGDHRRGHDGSDRNRVHLRGYNGDDRNRGVQATALGDDKSHGEQSAVDVNRSQCSSSHGINAGEQRRKRRLDNYISRVVEEEDWAARDQARGSRARSQSLHDRRDDGSSNAQNGIDTVEGFYSMVALMPLRQKKKGEGKEDQEAALIEPRKKTHKEDREDGHDMEMKMGWFSSLLCRADVYNVISST